MLDPRLGEGTACPLTSSSCPNLLSVISGFLLRKNPPVSQCSDVAVHVAGLWGVHTWLPTQASFIASVESAPKCVTEQLASSVKSQVSPDNQWCLRTCVAMCLDQ